MVEPAKPEHPTMPHHRPPLTRRQVFSQICVAAVILVSGIGIGSGGAILALKDRIIPRFKLMPPDPGPGPEPNFLVERWTEDYGLSDEQAKRVKETLTEQWAGTRDLWQKFMQAEQTQRQKFAEAMKKTLTPEQYERWEGDLKKRFEHFRGMRPFEGRPGGRGGPRGDRPRDRRMDPNDWRENWGPGGPQRDPNGPRGGRGPEGFMGPGGQRGDGRPPDRWMGDPNGPHGNRPPGGFMDFEGGPPPMPPADPNGRPDQPR